MSNWQTVTLEEVAESINTGLDAIRRAPIVEHQTNLRCLRIQDISQDKSFNEWGFTETKKSDYDKYKLTSGDIIIARTGGSIGVNKLIRNDLESVFNNGLARIRVNKNFATPEFIYCVMQSINFKSHIDAISSGTAAQPNMKIGDMAKFEFKLPPLNEQKKITETIFAFIDKIQLNTQTNQTLEQIAQALFKSWFVDFDPVRAKVQALSDGLSLEQAELAAMQAISGKTPEELTALSQTQPDRYAELAETAKAFPCEMVEVDGVEVPRGWEVKRIDEIANIIKGKSYKSSELEKSKTALVTLKSFNRGGGYRLDGLKEYTGKYKPEQEVFAGELIIAYTDVTQAADVIGKPAMVMSDSNYQHLVISLDVSVVRPFNDVYKHFLYCLAMTESFQAHTKSFCTGTTVLHLGKDAVPSFEFINPGNELLHVFYKQTSPIFEKINLQIEENKNLEKARDLLLPRLLSGEIE